MEPVSRQTDEESVSRQTDEQPAGGSGKAGRGDNMRSEGATPSDRRATPSGARFVFEQAWMVVACSLLIASAVILYLGHPSAAFVAAALGVSAWFLNVRTNLKRKHNLVKQGRRNWEPRDDDEE
jgi:Flp pilus assembly protein TadB